MAMGSYAEKDMEVCTLMKHFRFVAKVVVRET